MKLYSQTRKARTPRAGFDLSYNKLMTANLGLLYPALGPDEVLPGDVWSIGYELVVRAQPLLVPLIHPIDIYVEYYFIPWDLLDGDFEDIITGGEDGDESDTLNAFALSATYRGSGYLWDYFGLPVDVDPDAAWEPLRALWQCYNMVWNEYYRDQNVDDPVVDYQGELLRRRWKKDYFTAALPWQQRGTAPSLPIEGFADFDVTNTILSSSPTTEGNAYFEGSAGSLPYLYLNGGAANALGNARDFFDNNVLDATSIDLVDFRLGIMTQKLLERIARSGARYTEWLRGTFGVSPADERMERPEFLGGARTPLIVSEVLGTNQDDSVADQGKLAGHGIAVDRRRVCKFRAKEHGWILGLFSMIPKAVYQQGMPRQYVRRDRWDFYDPMFAGISEQAILQGEIFLDSSGNDTVFGYQGAWDEYRVKHSMVCGQLRSDHATSLDHWHLARDFASAPNLNSTFLACDPDTRFLADETDDGFIVNFGNDLRVVRPLPAYAIPGGSM